MSESHDPPLREVSRDEALAIAEAYLAGEGAGLRLGGTRVRRVLSLGEQASRTPMVYGVRSEDLADFWIAYVDTPDTCALRSSSIVLVSRATGVVSYAGSAYDEG